MSTIWIHVNILHDSEVLVSITVRVISHFKDLFDICFMCALWHVHGKLWGPEDSIRYPGTGTHKLPYGDAQP